MGFPGPKGANVRFYERRNIIHKSILSYSSLIVIVPRQGEPGKPGEKGLVGRPGLRVSAFSP